MRNKVTAFQIKLKPEFKEQYLKDRDAFEASLKRREGWGPYSNDIDIKQAAERLGITQEEANERIKRFLKAFGELRY
ncbi:MAG: hypothetical protein QXO69_01405, partial [archaeon]